MAGSDSTDPQDWDLEGWKMAEAEGSRAAMQGLPLSACPYGEGDPRRSPWDYGWTFTAGNRAILEGFDARRRGEPLDACPYDPERDGGLADAWRTGWEQPDYDRRTGQAQADEMYRNYLLTKENDPMSDTDPDPEITFDPEADADAAFHEKLADLSIPGFVAEFDPDEAERAGAFEEDALSEEDAMESAIDLPEALAPAPPAPGQAANDPDSRV